MASSMKNQAEKKYAKLTDRSSKQNERERAVAKEKGAAERAWDAKVSRLRELRLSKEAADREIALAEKARVKSTKKVKAQLPQ